MYIGFKKYMYILKQTNSNYFFYNIFNYKYKLYFLIFFFLTNLSKEKSDKSLKMFTSKP